MLNQTSPRVGLSDNGLLLAQHSDILLKAISNFPAVDVSQLMNGQIIPLRVCLSPLCSLSGSMLSLVMQEAAVRHRFSTEPTAVPALLDTTRKPACYLAGWQVVRKPKYSKPTEHHHRSQ